MTDRLSFLANGNVSVFEIANYARGEVFLTSTSLPIFEAFAEFSRSLPPEIAHWKPQRERMAFRSLEFNLNQESALACIMSRRQQPLLEGWKYILARPTLVKN